MYIVSDNKLNAKNFMFQVKLESLILSCKAAVNDPECIKALWDGVSDRMFSLVDRQKELGLGEKVLINCYYFVINH